MQYLKRGAIEETRVSADRKVRDVVEATLADIEARGDAAVRELSIKRDGWDRECYAPGGIQAVGAMALGTASIDPVDILAGLTETLMIAD